MPSRYTRIWFLRGIYRNASPQTESGRIAYVDGIADVLAKPITETGGKWLSSASSTGSQFSYSWLDGYALETLVALTEWCRGYLEDDDVDVSIALVPASFRYLSTSFRGMAH